MYAEPARAYIEARGGAVRTGARACIRVADGAVESVVVANEAWSAPAVVCAAPWFTLPEMFQGDLEPLRDTIDAARATAPSPIVTVNLWFDRVVMDEPFVGLPGRVMQWVFDKRAVFGESASHLSLVSSGAADVLRWTNPQLIESATTELREALPRVRQATVTRATVIREPRATFSLAPGQPAASVDAHDGPGTCSWPAIGSRPSLPATIEGAVRSGHLAAEAARPDMRSIVVHYKELALKGRNRPWFVQLLVRNLRLALKGLDVTHVRSVMGRIEIDLGPQTNFDEAARPHQSRVRHRELLAGGTGPARFPGAGGGDSQGSRRPAGVELPRQRAPRGQALSIHVSADRARGRAA